MIKIESVTVLISTAANCDVRALQDTEQQPHMLPLQFLRYVTLPRGCVHRFPNTDPHTCDLLSCPSVQDSVTPTCICEEAECPQILMVKLEDGVICMVTGGRWVVFLHFRFTSPQL